MQAAPRFPSGMSVTKSRRQRELSAQPKWVVSFGAVVALLRLGWQFDCFFHSSHHIHLLLVPLIRGLSALLERLPPMLSLQATIQRKPLAMTRISSPRKESLYFIPGSYQYAHADNLLISLQSQLKRNAMSWEKCQSLQHVFAYVSDWQS